MDTELGQRLAWPAIGLQENIRVRYSIDISMLLNDSYLDMVKLSSRQNVSLLELNY